MAAKTGTAKTFDTFANSLIASGDPYGAAAGATLKAINQIVTSLGIGTGRIEADRITPYQNELGRLLETANLAMANTGVSAQRLTEIKQAVVDSGESFLDYIRDRTAFPDGRASRQAEDTMFGAPGYLRVTVNNLDKTIAERSGVLGSLSSASGASPLLLGGLGLAALLLFRK